jgi:hypothetical protein
MKSPTPLFTTRSEILFQAEFTLITTTKGEIAAQLRFPPGCSRLVIRELVTQIKENNQVLAQRFIGNELQTTNWSLLIFTGDVDIYQWLFEQCRESNLSWQREATRERMSQFGYVKSSNETEANSNSVQDISFVSEENTEPVTTESSSSTLFATQEQLQALSLHKLKQLAANHLIQGRAAMTKNIKIAHKLLIPKLLGLVEVGEL